MARTQYRQPAAGAAYFLTYKRVKNINLRIGPDGEAHASAPCGVPPARVDAFVLSKAAWLEKAKAQAARRRAEEADLPAILAIADEAKAFLAAQGLDQWQHGYPAEEDFRRDIERGDGWLFTADGNPAGYLCISRRSEAAYTAIEGEWLSCAGPYLTIHRIMVSDAYRGKGIASEMISLADDFARAYCCAGVRIDTAPGNEPMRAMLRKNGFETCGTIRLVGGVDDGALRIALEKLVER